MLESISIQNYALIDQLNIDLSNGLNVITGETGAGKSIVINALSLLLGSRASKDNIRKNKKKMIVSGQFTFEDQSPVKEILNNHGIELDSNEIILTREVDRNGRNVCRVNGVIVPLSVLKEIGPDLIDIYSQHENVALFKPEYQRNLLDLYGNDDLLKIKETVQELSLKLRDLAKKIRELQTSSKEAHRNHAIDEFQYKEIMDAELDKNEEEDLKEKVDELAKQEKLYFQSYETTALLSSDDDSPTIDSLLESLSEQLSKLSGIDPFFNSYRKDLDNLINSFNSLSFDLTSYLNRIEFDPAELNQVQTRLAQIDDLKNKYGETIEEIQKYAQNLEEKINLYDNADFLLEESKNNYKSLRKDYNKYAKELTDSRIKAANQLKEDLQKELADLAMEKAQVEIKIDTDNDLISRTGQDSVSFLISSNPGQAPRELKQVASGGEISRIMLALKGLFGQKDSIETLIFDEIDTGISGRTAQTVAEKILSLSGKRQIICITHLPQIAAMADNQFVVEKLSDDETTQVSFNQLDENERSDELARMLGGAKVTDITRKNADEMLEQASLLKQKLN